MRATFPVLSCGFLLLILWTAPIKAGTVVKYPKDAPSLTFELPDGWTAEEQPGDIHPLLCQPKDVSLGLRVSFTLLPASMSRDEWKTTLHEIELSGAKDTHLEDVTYPEATEDSFPSGIITLSAAALGKLNGEDYVFSSTALFLPGGKHFQMIISGRNKVLDAKEKEMNALTDSIKPSP